MSVYYSSEDEVAATRLFLCVGGRTIDWSRETAWGSDHQGLSLLPAPVLHGLLQPVCVCVGGCVRACVCSACCAIHQPLFGLLGKQGTGRKEAWAAFTAAVFFSAWCLPWWSCRAVRLQGRRRRQQRQWRLHSSLVKLGSKCGVRAFICMLRGKSCTSLDTHTHTPKGFTLLQLLGQKQQLTEWTYCWETCFVTAWKKPLFLNTPPLLSVLTTNSIIRFPFSPS